MSEKKSGRRMQNRDAILLDRKLRAIKFVSVVKLCCSLMFE